MADKIYLDSNRGNDELGMSDSDEEFDTNDKLLLKKYKEAQAGGSESEQEEVFGLPEDDSMDDDSDFEDKTGAEKFEADSDIVSDEDDDIPDDRAWGNKKSVFYNTDFVDQDYGSYNAQEEQLAQLEEQETRKLQQRLTQQLSRGRIRRSLKASRTLQFKRDSPEFDALVDELLSKLDDSANILQPFLDELKKHNLTELPIYEFIDMRNRLSLHYATNLSFYLMLKHKKVSVKSHPVMKRIAQFRELLQQLEEKYQGEAQTEMERILLEIRSGKLVAAPVKEKEKKQRKMLGILKNVAEKPKKTSEESAKEDMELQGEEEGSESEEGMEEIGDGEDDNDKRAITYQMAKNKGLMPHRKKELRNPRVKHRLKYKKALVRRKGAVRTVRQSAH
uniref:Sas10 C-terminal domain-containing protein n=1 Tax=Phlebotomus papatasi TaxID=29031 RepID=A0A1B0D7S6_PHLPP